MSWRARHDWQRKVAGLDPRVRPQCEAFLDGLDAIPLPFALGDTGRSIMREWELWKQGRYVPVGADAADATAWAVSVRGLVVTNVPPGSGKGPHFHWLAMDVYPLDEHGALMQTTHHSWIETIEAMWALAEACGLDALGHDDPTRTGDALWSGDPCHYQALNWKMMVQAKEV